MPVKIAPSLLSSDFANLEAELHRIDTADMAHVDVMDNHFVPNLTLGLPIFKRLVEVSPIPLDAHLMIEDPDRWAPDFAAAGAFSVTFHAEAVAAPVRLANELRRLGARSAIALRPATPVDHLLDLLEFFDMVLIMTVDPGFGGQSFIEGSLAKIRKVRSAITERRLDTWVQVDGGVTRANIARCAAAGANVFVAGSAVFGADDVAAEITQLRGLAKDVRG